MANASIVPLLMKKFLLLPLFALLFQFGYAQNSNRGQLLSFLRLDSLDQQEILSLYNSVGLPPFLAPIDYSVELYKLTYLTPAAKGDTLTTASGLLMIPISEDKCFPIFNYNHGTSEYGDEISSLGPEWFLGLPFAAGGYILVMPDYLGYGETPLSHPHPYIHAKTEASATIDMIRASKTLCQLFDVGLNGQLFLGGYSQGGHTTAATQREIEKNHANEFKLTAVATGSGPFDISKTSRNRLLEEKPTNAWFLAFIMNSYQYVYENLWNNPSEAFVAPFDSILPRYFDREIPNTPTPIWPDTAIRMLKPAFIQVVKMDSMHPVNKALRDNDLLDWTPQAPLRMYYCEGDEVVPFQNSLIALSQFVARGAPNVTAIGLDPSLNHGTCTFPTMLSMKGWFDNLVKECTIPELTKDTSSTQTGRGLVSAPTSNEETLISNIKLYPNPATDFVIVDIPSDLKVEYLEIWSAAGKIVHRKQIVSKQIAVELDLSQLNSGVFWLKVQLTGKATFFPIIVKK